MEPVTAGALPVKMTTLEKLFAQIFERKTSILQQVKRQTDSYSQHLASKLLIQGITPPSWLWNPYQSSNLEELNKDELISDIVLPRAWPSTYEDARHSICKGSLVTGNNAELSDGAFVETRASGADLQDGAGAAGPNSPAVVYNCNNECALSSLPQLDAGVTMPQDEIDTRTESTLAAPVQSLVKIQRSKSRQKALELRNSANAKSRSHSSIKNKSDVTSTGIDLSASLSEQVTEPDKFPEQSMPVSGHYELPAERSSPESENLIDNSTRSEQVTEPHKFPESSMSEKEMDVKTGGVTISRSSLEQHKCVRDSFTENRSCIARKSNSGLAHSIVGLLDQSVTISSSGITAKIHDGCNATIKCYSCSQEKVTGTYCGRTTKSMSSIQQRPSIRETLQVDACSYLAKVTENTASQSSRETSDKLVDSKQQLESVQSSFELDNRSSEPQCYSGCEVIPSLGNVYSIASLGGAGTKSAASQKSPCVNQYVQDVPHDNAILISPVKCGAYNQLGNGEADASEYIVPQNSQSKTSERKGLECLAATLHSDCLMQVKPKQLGFDDMEEFNLKGYTHCNSEDVNLDVTNKERSCTTLNRFSLRGVPSSSPDITISEKNVNLKLDSCNTVTRLSILPVELTLQDHDRSKRCAVDIKVHTPKGLGDPEAFPCFGNSNIPPGDYMLSNTSNSSDAKHHHRKRSPRDRSESLIEPYLEVGVSECERHDEGMSCASESKTFAASCISKLTDMSTGDHQKWLDDEIPNDDRMTSSSAPGGQLYVQGDRCNDTNLRLPESKKTEIAQDFPLLERKSISATVNSWPQVKRRKLEDQLSNCFSASHNSQMPKYCNIKMSSESTGVEIIEKQVKDVLKEDSCVGSLTSELCPMVDHHAPEGLGLNLVNSNNCMFKVRDPECATLNTDGCYTPNEQVHAPTDLEDGVLQVSSKTKEAISDSSGYVIEKTGGEIPDGPNFDACKRSDEHDIKSALNHKNGAGLVDNSGSISYTGKIVLKHNSNFVEDNVFPHSFFHSSHDEVVNTHIVDTLPMYEGFIIDPPVADGKLDVSEAGINFEALALSETTIERASILEQICRSASMQRPSSDLSSALKLHRSHTLYQSLPEGLLEQGDLRNTSFYTEDIDKQLRHSTSCAEEVRDEVKEMSYSDCVGYSGAIFKWKSGSPYASPVGKLWERTSSHSGSLKKQLSSNPELTCFPIKEDSAIGEENENMDKLADEVQYDIDSLVGNSDAERNPPFDIASACLNPLASVSAAKKKVQAGGRMDFAKSDVDLSATRNNARRKLRSHSRNVSEGKENQPLMMTAKKKKKLSHSNASKKHELSAASCLRKKEEKLSERWHKHDNIVSNLTSFIPLVHKKQAATLCTGKKDVKIKALEAAEAAKRHDEKKEIERKKRKEENLRQLEINKQKKQDERKKKEAEVLARKRMRAEEEKNDKEKKRLRIGELRRQQNEEEKFRVKKVDVEKKCSAIVGKPIHAEILENDNSGATVSHDSLDTSDDQSQHETKLYANFDKQDQNFTAMGAQLKSYEISPYKCSDDEGEDEDEEETTQKPIPSWARKNCVAQFLLFQQEMDPDFIFHPNSLCSIDEGQFLCVMEQPQILAFY
ncbi:unnamed protein product [Cuscuta epithymum]|uniref:Inner centromere protein ARK-binding domain-containing protein n=1 Tax=Cuscuta epithymum TaxID=186058 RepID=A0AAV0DUR7_9ASTE|nr:unnamed protein product [Cuscuta epithymum]